VFSREREDPEDAADAWHAVVLLDVQAHRADGRAGRRRPRQQRQRRGRRARRPVLIVDLVPAAAHAEMLAQELAGRRRQQADVEIVPLHLHALPSHPGGAK
jgi:hypothetical protein